MSKHKIYIPLHENEIPEIIKEQLFFEDGYYFDDSDENRKIFQDYMPFGFRENFKPLKIDLIPKTSWGASLSNALTSDCWNAIRKPFISYHGNRCQLCGQRGKSLSNSIQDVDTHEIWEYSPLSEKNKTQKLVGFLALCSNCHLMFHLGFANHCGKYENTRLRIKKLEKLSDKEVDLKIKNIFDIWEKRSEYNWKIDISILKEYGFDTIEFKKNKSKIDPNDFIL